jgi:uncharacterized membrane protein
MRIWVSVAGASDAAALALPIIIGVALVPATYLVGASLFSKRVGLLAAAFAAVSPALTEHSALVRPYSLLPLLALISSFALIRGLEGGNWRAWAGYVIATLLMLYTHNWGWLVLGGEWVAVIVVLVFDVANGRRRRGIAGEWLVAQLLVGVGYLPWLPWFLYQTRHAGHAPLLLDGVEEVVVYLTLATRALFQATVLAYPSARDGTIMATAQRWAAVVPVLVLGVGQFLRARRSRQQNAATAGQADDEPSEETGRTAVVVFLVVPLAAWAAAVVLSPWSDILLPRCLVTLAPGLLLLLAYWLSGRRRAQLNPLAGVAIVAFLVSYVGSILSLAQTTRSNARELAAVVSRRTEPSDLLVVAPEWMASSFNYYFMPAIEQIDFPHFDREGAVDFAELREHMADAAAFALVQRRIEEARRADRRVWLIMEERDVRDLSANDLAKIVGESRLNAMGMIRANQIREKLTSAYGLPDTSLVAHDRLTQFELLRAFLFTPPERRAH